MNLWWKSCYLDPFRLLSLLLELMLFKGQIMSDTWWVELKKHPDKMRLFCKVIRADINSLLDICYKSWSNSRHIIVRFVTMVMEKIVLWMFLSVFTVWMEKVVSVNCVWGWWGGWVLFEAGSSRFDLDISWGAELLFSRLLAGPIKSPMSICVILFVTNYLFHPHRANIAIWSSSLYLATSPKKKKG